MPGRARWAFLVPCLLIPLVVATLWNGVYTDSAYAGFQWAEAIAAGQGWTVGGLSLPLAMASLLRLPLPTVAVVLGTVGWLVAIVAWFLTGLKLGQPAFSVVTAVLFALHPQQGRALGLEPGLVLGLLGLATYFVVQGRLGAVLIITPVLAVVQPLALFYLVPLFAFRWVRKGSATTLIHIAIGAAVGAAGYAVACYAAAGAASGGWDDPGLTAPLLAMLQILVAAGLAVFTHTFPRWVLSNGIVALCLAALALGQVSLLVQDWWVRPIDRLALYETLALWLREEALPAESIGAREAGLLGYLSRRSVIPLSDHGHTSALLASIQRTLPDYCVALNSLAWQGVVRQPWFEERYEQVHQLASPNDSATPLSVFRYTPTRFDEGDIISVSAAFVNDAGGRVELTAYRLDSRRLVPGEPLHLTLYWRAAAPLNLPLRLTLRLVDPATGEPWMEMENPAPGGLATDLWNSGVQISDRYTLIPPADLLPKDYVLDVAFHQPSGAPMNVVDDRVGESDRLAFAQVSLPPNVSTAPVEPDHTLRAVFGDEIELIGYDVRSRVRPGETLRVALYWRAMKPVSQDYKVFVHLQGPQEEAVAQDDGIPVGWTYPTRQWQVGEIIRDEHMLVAPPSTPRGDYQLDVGLYDQADGERPVVVDDAGNELVDRIVTLQQIQVR